MATNSIKLLTGNSHPELAKLVADRFVIPIPSIIPQELEKLITVCTNYRLGIELTKIMVLQYSNQETSVSIGESVRDEDGTADRHPIRSHPGPPLTSLVPSLRPPVHCPRRYQRWAHGTSHHHQRLQNRLRPTHHGSHSQLPLRAPGQKGQISSPNHSQADGQYVTDCRM